MGDRDDDASRLAAIAIERRDPTGWFETLYSEAADGTAIVPWDRGEPNPVIATRVGTPERAGTPALVVGCGYGTDAEFIASLGYRTTAFDISATAIDGARAKFPDSSVTYEVADVLDLPTRWVAGFDLVVESITVQSMPLWVRSEAISAIASTVAAGGTLLVVSGIREDGVEVDGPPWPMTYDEVSSFASAGLSTVRVERVPDENRWCATFVNRAA